jgi:hypothetical protein
VKEWAFQGKNEKDENCVEEQDWQGNQRGIEKNVWENAKHDC